MTQAQNRAANPATSAWVKAAAGTGKTRVLRDRVLRLLLAGTEPQRILCLTYTKAAAAEMANRIQDALARWVTADDADLAKDLTAIGEPAPTSETLETARRLFADVLETPGGMKIQTIHAFCQSVLARFPLEASMAPHFTQMEDDTGRELQRDALDAVLAEAGTQPSPALNAAIDDLAGRCSDHALSDLTGKLFAARAQLQHLWEQTESLGQPGLERALAERLGFDGPPDAAAMMRDACHEDAFERASLTRVARAMLESGVRDQERGQKIADWLAADEEARAEDIETYMRGYLTDKGTPYASPASKAVQKEIPDALDILGREAMRLLALRDALNLAETFTASTSLHRLGRQVVERYNVLKLRQALMDYADLILNTLALFRSPDIAPWVLYKLDGGIDHILVDEAQDTSPDQWGIIDVLVEEFFTGESAQEAARTVFAVGDVQQSIYRFQGAVPEEFDKYRARFKARAQNAGAAFTEERLNLTFRTAQPVLNVVNQVFNQDNVTHREKAPGLVELWPVHSAIKADDDEEAWRPPLTQFERDDPSASCATAIATHIESLLTSGDAVADEDTGEMRAVRPGDVMVLVRRRNEFVSHMIRELTRRGIAVAGADRMVLMEELVVMDLMAAASVALLPEDDLTLACLLKGPLGGLSEEQLFDLAHPRKGTLWDELKARRGDDPAFAAAHDLVAELLASADQMPPFEFLSHVLHALEGRRKLVARLGEQAIDPMEELLTLALTFENTHTPSLQEFLHWMESGTFEIKRETDSQRDEVRVMTVHGAKGLEAPIVFLPDTCGKPQARGDLLWMEEEGLQPMMVWPPSKDYLAGPALAADQARALAEQAEYDRLLYVAMTRARDRLYVTGFEKRPRADDCWYARVEGALDSMGESVAAMEIEGLGPVRRYGEPGQIAARKVAVPAEAKIELPAWATSEPPAEPTPPRPLTPSRPEDEDPPVMSPGGKEGQKRYARGRLMHRLLELLPDLAPEERQAAGERFLAQQRPPLPEDTQADYLSEVLAIIEDPAYAAFFGPGSAAEIPIVGLSGGRPVAGQVDRLAVSDDAIHIIDYKTNRPAPMEAGAVPPAYRKQMATYKEILGKIYPGRRIVTALLWTEGPRLLVLDDI